MTEPTKAELIEASQELILQAAPLLEKAGADMMKISALVKSLPELLFIFTVASKNNDQDALAAIIIQIADVAWRIQQILISATSENGSLTQLNAALGDGSKFVPAINAIAERAPVSKEGF